MITTHLDESDDFEENRQLAPSNARFFVTAGGSRVGVCCLAPGAPAMATQLQNLVHAGVRRFVSIGTAGGLREELQPGQIVVFTAAVRDDGVSQHFAAPSRYAEPDDALTARLEEALRARGGDPLRGKTWTTAVPFRITAREPRGVRRRRCRHDRTGSRGSLRGRERARRSERERGCGHRHHHAGGAGREDWRAAAEPLRVLLDAAMEALL